MNEAALRQIEMEGTMRDFCDFLCWLSRTAVEDDDHEGPDWEYDVVAAVSTHARFVRRLEMVAAEPFGQMEMFA